MTPPRLLLLVALTAWLLAAPARAQTVTVTNGATLTVAGDAVLDLAGATLDFGGVSETASLVETGGGHVAGGTLTATRTLTAPSGVDVAGLGFVITTSADLGATSITRGHTAQTDGSNEGILRYYDVTPTQNNSGLSASITFHYDDDELNGLTESSLRLFRREEGGSTWTPMGGTVDAGANEVSASGIDHFSRWTLSSEATPLPVELTAFDAVVDGSTVRLTWHTATETNNAGFEVQYHHTGTLTDGTPMVWTASAFVEGRGTTLEAQQYAYAAEGLVPGRYVFRLRQVDYDGTFAYGPEVAATVTMPGTHDLVAAGPNPFRTRTALRLTVAETQHVRVEAFDALGRQVAVLFDGQAEALTPGVVLFERDGLAPGLYVVRVVGEHFAASRRFIRIP